MVNPVCGDFIAGAGETYSAHNYDMVLSLVPDSAETAAYQKLRAKGNVDGMILHGPKLNDVRLGVLRNLNLPFVVHGRVSDNDDSYTWVDINNRSAFERATELLLQFGHRKIVLLNGLEDMDFAIRRRNGFTTALLAAGITPNQNWIYSEEMTEVYGYQKAKALLSAPDAPTAFLVSSLVTTLGVRRAAEELGLKLGKDISVITHDDDLSYLPNGVGVPIFTATKSSVREAGRVAAQLLLDIIMNGPDAAQSQLLEAQLVMGQSTGPAPQS